MDIPAITSLNTRDVLAGLQGVLANQNLAAFEVADPSWLLVQRQSFDLFLRDEPFHALQILLNLGQGQYFVRVFGKTKEAGQVRNLPELQDLCLRTFQTLLPCVGHVIGLKRLEGVREYDGDVVKTDFPVPRFLSSKCETVCAVGNEPSQLELDGWGMCKPCQELNLPGPSEACKDNFSCDQYTQTGTPQTTIKCDESTGQKEAEQVPVKCEVILETEELEEEDNWLNGEEGEEEEDMDTNYEIPQKRKRKSAPVPIADVSELKAPQTKFTFFLKRMTKNISFNKQKVEEQGRSAWYFVCSVCPTTCRRPVKMWVHMHRVHLLDLYKCSECSQEFNFPNEVVQHKKEEHNSVDNFQIACPICSFSYPIEEDSFVEHLKDCLKKEVLPTDNRPKKAVTVRVPSYKDRMTSKFDFPITQPMGPIFGCTICKEEEKTRPKIWLHMHQQHQLDLYKCVHCEQESDFPNELVKHIDEKHANEEDRLGNCPRCKTYHSIEEFVEHVQNCDRLRIIPDDLREKNKVDKSKGSHRPHSFKCDQCHIACCDEEGLAKHKKIHTGETKPTYFCTECDHAAYTKHAINIHQRIHLREKGLTQTPNGDPLFFTCEMCGDTLKSMASLNEHISAKHKNSPRALVHQCEQCGQVCDTKRKLLFHKNQVHTERYKCHICGRCFQGKFNLDWHVDYVHNGPPPSVECDECGKKVRFDRLMYHKRLHSGEKPYKCQYCTMCYVSSSSRRTHIKIKHPEHYNPAKIRGVRTKQGATK